MPYRTIRDEHGRTWEVWDVQPSGAERRRGRDRRQAPRESPDRRQRREARLVVAPGYEQGWLAFQCDQERRRLAPPPAAWPALPDEGLLALLQQAAVYVTARRLIE